MMDKKFMFWLLWIKVDEKIIKRWEKMKMISSIEIIRLRFQRWWNEWFDLLKMKINWKNEIKNLIKFIIVYFVFIFVYFIFSFYFFQKQKEKEDEQKNETQQRIINS